jgi:hypothetical protein
LSFALFNSLRCQKKTTTTDIAVSEQENRFLAASYSPILFEEREEIRNDLLENHCDVALNYTKRLSEKDVKFVVSKQLQSAIVAQRVIYKIYFCNCKHKSFNNLCFICDVFLKDYPCYEI